MWDFFKQAAQKGMALGHEYYEQRRFAEQLLVFPTADQARAALQAAMPCLNDQSRGMLIFALTTMASQEQVVERQQRLETLARAAVTMRQQTSDHMPPDSYTSHSVTPARVSTQPPAAPSSSASAPSSPAPVPTNAREPIPIQHGPPRGPCTDCRHFRSVRPLSVLLEAEFGRFDVAVAQALGEVRRAEQSLQEQEAKNKIQILSGGYLNDRWQARPIMSSYCGLQEQNGVYLFHEAKNPAPPWTCEDFKPEVEFHQTCATCVHCLKATGDTFDRNLIVHHEGWANIGNIPIGNQAHFNASGAQAALQSHMNSIGPRKAQELTAVFNARGTLGRKPFYLDYCRAFSKEGAGKFVVCLTQNSHGACHQWTRPCPRCGQSGNPGKHFCSSCGAALAVSPDAAVVIFATGPSSDPIVRSGDYTFLLNRGKLQVWKSGEAAQQQTHYDVSRLPMGEWHALQDGQGKILPIAVVNNGGQFQARVDTHPDATLRTLALSGMPVERQRQIIELFLNYDHPRTNYRVVWNFPNKELLWIRDPITMEVFDVDVSQLRNGQWRALRDRQNRELPIRVGREQGKLMLEWL